MLEVWTDGLNMSLGIQITFTLTFLLEEGRCGKRECNDFSVLHPSYCLDRLPPPMVLKFPLQIA